MSFKHLFAAIPLLAQAAKATPLPAPGLDWTNCTAELEATKPTECANLTVPVNWSDPSDGAITIALARVRCGDPASRIGSLFYNPGGPGAGVIQGLFESAVSEEVQQRFDIVAMDPRGVGRSTPFNCTFDVGNLTGGWPVTDTEYSLWKAKSRSLAEDCYKNSGEIVKHLDAASVARDLEAARVALNDGKLNFIGWSYGTLIASAYAELYPSNFRALILDGVYDHTVGPTERVLSDHVSMEAGLRRFADWCDKNAKCALHSQDALQAFDKALNTDKSMTDCLSVPMQQTLQNGRVAWPDLAQVVQKVLNGTLNANSDSWTSNHTMTSWCDGAHDPKRRASTLAITCSDFDFANLSAYDFINLQRMIDVMAPGAKSLAGKKTFLAGCTGWPFTAQNSQHRLAFPFGSPPAPVLVVNSLYDLTTPYNSAVNVQSQIPGSVLLTTRVSGHTSYHHGTGEAAKMMDAYLINGTLPAPDTIVEG